MSSKYKFRDQDSKYFISFAVVGWIDIFSRQIYRDIFIESLQYCQKEKGLVIHAYIIMSNHVHLIVSRKSGVLLEAVMRDLKKFTSYRILKEIKENPRESRREWLLYLFATAGAINSNNTNYQFWRQDNHPIELDVQSQIINQKLDYIHQNPVEAGIVDIASAYLYSSARDYEGIKGLLNIEILD